MLEWYGHHTLIHPITKWCIVWSHSWFWSDEDIELLEFPRVVSAAAVKQRKDDIAAVVATEEEISVEDLQFGTWTVSSRSFQTQMSAPGDGSNTRGDVDEGYC